MYQYPFWLAQKELDLLLVLLLLLLLLRCFDNFNDHNWFSPRSPWYFPHAAEPRQPPRAFILKYAALPPQTAHSCPTSTAHTPLPHSIQHPNPPHHLASKWLQHSTSLYGNNNQMFLHPPIPQRNPRPSWWPYPCIMFISMAIPCGVIPTCPFGHIF